MGNPTFGRRAAVVPPVVAKRFTIDRVPSTVADDDILSEQPKPKQPRQVPRWVWWVGGLVVLGMIGNLLPNDPRSSVPARQATAQAPTWEAGSRVRATKIIFGCPTLNGFDNTSRMYLSGDREAAAKIALRAGCVLINAGDVVTVTYDSGTRINVRPQGDPDSYWSLSSYFH
jgi:hypothetical protein